MALKTAMAMVLVLPHLHAVTGVVKIKMYQQTPIAVSGITRGSG